MSLRAAFLAAALVVVTASALPGEEAAEGEATSPRMAFATKADGFAEAGPALVTAGDRLYARVTFGRPWKELMRKAQKGTSVVVNVFEGEEHKGHAAFFPGEAGFARDAVVLELLPDPATATQFLFGVPRALASLAPGKHELRIQLWSMEATTPDMVLAEGKLAFEATEDGAKALLALVDRLKEAKAARDAAPPKPATDAARVQIRRAGSDHVLLRGDEIVLDGAVVGRFEGAQVRKGGSVVGEIRGTTFRYEGADAFQLDKGNLYPGIEVRWEGAIIGNVQADGVIRWEGSDWGRVSPYGGTDAETMRVLATLYCFSDFFRRK